MEFSREKEHRRFSYQKRKSCMLSKHGIVCVDLARGWEKQRVYQVEGRADGACLPIMPKAKLVCNAYALNKSIFFQLPINVLHVFLFLFLAQGFVSGYKCTNVY